MRFRVKDLVIDIVNQVHLSISNKKHVDNINGSVGMILDETHASQIPAAKQPDLLGFGRKFIRGPRWLYTAGRKGSKRLAASQLIRQMSNLNRLSQ